jgi:hypothetical protein
MLTKIIMDNRVQESLYKRTAPNIMLRKTTAPQMRGAKSVRPKCTVLAAAVEVELLLEPVEEAPLP